MDENKDIESFREKLEAVSEWPSLYMFKFIVPEGKQNLVKEIFRTHDVKERPSRNGKYMSLTINILASSSDQIIEKYIQTNKIEGLIAL